MLFLKVYESFKSTNAGNTVSTCMWHVFWTSLISPSGSRQNSRPQGSWKNVVCIMLRKVHNVKNISENNSI